MRRKSVEVPRLPAKGVTYEQKLHDIETARRAGHLILQCGTPALDGHQTVSLNPVNKSDARLWYDWKEACSVEGVDTQYRVRTGRIEQITYRGVQRRQGWLRRYAPLNIDLEELSVGDIVGLQIEGELCFSQPIRGIEAPESALVVAEEKQLYIPKLAISAE